MRAAATVCRTAPGQPRRPEVAVCEKNGPRTEPTVFICEPTRKALSQEKSASWASGLRDLRGTPSARASLLQRRRSDRRRHLRWIISARDRKDELLRTTATEVDTGPRCQRRAKI